MAFTSLPITKRGYPWPSTTALFTCALIDWIERVISWMVFSVNLFSWNTLWLSILEGGCWGVDSEEVEEEGEEVSLSLLLLLALLTL